MSTKTKVTLSKGGSLERTQSISQIVVPDLWHIAEALRKTGKVHDGPACADSILKCWNLTHDLHRHIQESP